MLPHHLPLALAPPGGPRPGAFPLTCRSKPAASRQFLPVRPSPKAQRRAAVQPQASMEVAQLAGEAGFIFGVSGVMVGITLIVSGGTGLGVRRPPSMIPCFVLGVHWHTAAGTGPACSLPAFATAATNQRMATEAALGAGRQTSPPLVYTPKAAGQHIQAARR